MQVEAPTMQRRPNNDDHSPRERIDDLTEIDVIQLSLIFYFFYLCLTFIIFNSNHMLLYR